MDSDLIYDIAIVGAGPAGTSAAAILEKHFDSVLLLERAKFPRKKVCAGVLPPRIYTEIEIPDSIQERKLTGYRIFSPSGMSVESSFDQEGLIVRREVFDKFLVDKLETEPVHDKLQNVQINDDFVKLICQNSSNRAKVVIGADGVNSVVRKALGIQMEKVATAVQYEVLLPEQDIIERIGNWFEVYYVLPYGYAWLSPLKTSLKIGMGGVSDDFAKNAKKYLDKFLDDLGEKLVGSKIELLETWRIPMGGPLPTLTGHRSILVGDAGGFVYPGTGEGIYYGMKSGRLAGETIIEAFEQQRFDQKSLAEMYTQKLKANGLLSLRDINFIDEVLVSENAAEKYVKKLKILGSR